MSKNTNNKNINTESNNKYRKEFLTGSRYFFSIYSEFLATNPDIDTIVLWEGKDSHRVRVEKDHIHEFFIFQKKDKYQMIQDAIDSGISNHIMNFLIPEFSAEIGFTINDLSLLQSMANNLDEKHLYEKIIFESYLENNDFVLTDEQRLAAYNKYKEARGL